MTVVLLAPRSPSYGPRVQPRLAGLRLHRPEESACEDSRFARMRRLRLQGLPADEGRISPDDRPSETTPDPKSPLVRLPSRPESAASGIRPTSGSTPGRGASRQLDRLFLAFMIRAMAWNHFWRGNLVFCMAVPESTSKLDLQRLGRI